MDLIAAENLVLRKFETRDVEQFVAAAGYSLVCDQQGKQR